MDKKRWTAIYSLDLSTAFDLLRADKLREILEGKIEQGLLLSLLDFLKGGSFKVKVAQETSDRFELDRGCVQGSVLGPSLFSLYGGELHSILDEAWITTYADDSYVVVSDENLDSLTEKQSPNTMNT